MAEAGPVGGQCCVPNWARSPHQFHVADASPHSRRCHHLLHHIQHSTFSTSYCTDPSSGEGKTKQSKHVLNMVFGNIIYYILYTKKWYTKYYVLYTIYYILYYICVVVVCTGFPTIMRINVGEIQGYMAPHVPGSLDSCKEASSTVAHCQASHSTRWRT